MRRLVFTRGARNDLARLRVEVREMMIGLLQAYVEGEDVDSEAMRGRPGLRLKAGEYRAIVEVDRAVITVMRVRHRSVVYRP